MAAVPAPAFAAEDDADPVLSVEGYPPPASGSRGIVPLGDAWDDELHLTLSGDTTRVRSFWVEAQDVDSPIFRSTVDTEAPFETRLVPADTVPGKDVSVTGYATLDNGSLLQIDSGTHLVGGDLELEVWPGTQLSPDHHLLNLSAATVRAEYRSDVHRFVGLRSGELRLDGAVVDTWQRAFGSSSPVIGRTTSAGTGDQLTLGTHRWDVTVTDWAGRTATASTTFQVDEPLTMSGPTITDAAGRRVTASSWVLDGARLRYRTSVTRSPAYDGTLSWEVWAENGNGGYPVAGLNNDADLNAYPCLDRATCSFPRTIDKTWFASWCGRTRTQVTTTLTHRSQRFPSEPTVWTDRIRVYPRSAFALTNGTRATVTAGTAVTLAARLQTPGVNVSRRFPGEAVVLEKRRAGSAAWTAVTTRTTSSTGAVSAKVTPSSNSLYRWRHADHVGVAGPATSAATTTNVRPKVTLSVRTAQPSARSLTTIGVTSSKPQRDTSIYLQRLVGGTWRTIDVKEQGSTGTVTFRVRLPAGTVKLRAKTTPTTAYATGTSTVRTLAVTP
ncbi:hypothetical protein [Promicromonospora panici]|uniref:hypothetical protein n=1 Tax=Promicromonospora panici TaxID=2219658 RepID=UPI00101CCCE4|nr:hypothetical protein [Promicromonospora panici]